MSYGLVIMVTGGRDFDDRELLRRRLDAVRRGRDEDDIILLHGGAKGADELAAEWAARLGIRTIVFGPDYKRWPSKLAPLIRNHEMAAFAGGAQFAGADAVCVAFPTERSTGTWNAVRAAEVFQVEVVNATGRRRPPQVRR